MNTMTSPDVAPILRKTTTESLALEVQADYDIKVCSHASSIIICMHGFSWKIVIASLIVKCYCCVWICSTMYSAPMIQFYVHT